MSTNSISAPATEPVDAVRGESALSLIAAVFRPFASLRLTVALFGMGIFIILVGTLAQVEKDMWDVIDDYFAQRSRGLSSESCFRRRSFPTCHAFQAGSSSPAVGPSASS